jgi:hypothetical protein
MKDEGWKKGKEGRKHIVRKIRRMRNKLNKE